MIKHLFSFIFCLCFAYGKVNAQELHREHELAIKLLPIGAAYEWHGLSDLSIELGFTTTRANVPIPDPSEPLGIAVLENGQRETHFFLAAKRYYLMDQRRSLHYGLNINARVEHDRTPEVKRYYETLTNQTITDGYVYGPGVNLGYTHLVKKHFVVGLDIYSFVAINNKYDWEGILYHLRIAYRV